MDRLETTKAAHAHDDAIADDEAGEAYVEQFGLETFDRAERAVRANKVTKQTADTFLAAATFLELINIWHELDQETSSKIRYAKWNAVRIVKAIKDGVDPNDSNPQHTEPVVEEDPLDPEDPEVKQFQDAQTEGGAQDSVADLQPTVEEVPDETDKTSKHLAAQSRLDESLHPSAEPSQTSTPLPSAPSQPPHHGYRTYSFPPASTSSNQVSPIDVSPNASIPRDARSGSVGGGYFPSVPSAIGSSADATEPASATSPATSHFFPKRRKRLPRPPRLQIPQSLRL
jgi:vacuolar protein sorting-associated protein VTA1